MGGAGKAFSGPAHVTAFITVFHGIARAGSYDHMIKVPQPPSQPSKDVGKFHVAASRTQVAISNSSEVHWLFNAQFLRGSSTAAEAKSRFELRLKRLKKKLIISQLQMFMLLFG